MERRYFSPPKNSQMATAEQLKALLKSYGDGNGEHFASVALQIAADAARSGKSQLAQQLKDLVDDIKRKQASEKLAVQFLSRGRRVSSHLYWLQATHRLGYPKWYLPQKWLSHFKGYSANIADSQAPRVWLHRSSKASFGRTSRLRQDDDCVRPGR